MSQLLCTPLIIYALLLRTILSTDEYLLLHNYIISTEESFKNDATGTSLFGFSVVRNGNKMYISAPLAYAGTETKPYSKGALFECDVGENGPPQNCRHMTSLSANHDDTISDDLFTGFAMSINLDNKLYVCSPNSYQTGDQSGNKNCFVYDEQSEQFNVDSSLNELNVDIGLFIDHDIESNCFVVSSSQGSKELVYKAKCVINSTPHVRIEHIPSLSTLAYHTDVVVYSLSSHIYVSFVLPNDDGNHIDRVCMSYSYFAMAGESLNAQLVKQALKYNVNDGFGSRILKYKNSNGVFLIYSAPFYDSNKGQVAVYSGSYGSASYNGDQKSTFSGENPQDMFGFSIIFMQVEGKQMLTVLSRNGGAEKLGSIKLISVSDDGHLSETDFYTFNLNQHIADIDNDVYAYKIHPDIYESKYPITNNTHAPGFLLSVNSNPGKLYRFSVHKIGLATLSGVKDPLSLSKEDLIDYNVSDDTYHFRINPIFKVDLDESIDIATSKEDMTTKWVLELDPLELHGIIKFNTDDYGHLLIGEYTHPKAGDTHLDTGSSEQIDVYINKKATAESLKNFKLIMRYGPLKYQTETDYYMKFPGKGNTELTTDVLFDIPMLTSASEMGQLEVDIHSTLMEIIKWVDDEGKLYIYESVEVILSKNEYIFLNTTLLVTYPEAKELLIFLSYLDGAYTHFETTVVAGKKTSTILMSNLQYKGTKLSFRFRHLIDDDKTKLINTYEWTFEIVLNDNKSVTYARNVAKFMPINGFLTYDIEGIKNKVFNTHPNTWEKQIFSNSFLISVNGWGSHFSLVLKITKDTTEDFKLIKIIKISCKLSDFYDKDDNRINCPNEEKCLNHFHSAKCDLKLKKHITNNYVAIHYQAISEVKEDIVIGFTAELLSASSVNITGKPLHLVTTIHPITTTIKIWEIALCVAIPLVIYLIIFIVLFKTGTLNSMSIRLGRLISKERSL